MCEIIFGIFGTDECPSGDELSYSPILRSDEIFVRLINTPGLVASWGDVGLPHKPHTSSGPLRSQEVSETTP